MQPAQQCFDCFNPPLITILWNCWPLWVVTNSWVPSWIAAHTSRTGPTAYLVRRIRMAAVEAVEPIGPSLVASRFREPAQIELPVLVLIANILSVHLVPRGAGQAPNY